MRKEKLEKLAAEKSSACITISMNTHRTSPDNLEDIVRLKNLLNEAHERVTQRIKRLKLSFMNLVKVLNSNPFLTRRQNGVQNNKI